MAPSFEDFIQSDQFTFFIGNEGTPVVVHAAAVAATSQQLDALINGGMEESKKRGAKIEDVRVNDFIRFCEYAYRGDYTVPPSQEDSHQEEPPPQSNFSSGTVQQNGDDDDVGLGFGLRSKAKKKGKKRWTEPEPMMEIAQVESVFEAVSESQAEATPMSRTHMRTQFNSWNYLIDSSLKTEILENFEPKANSSVHQNFTPVFLAHARLYCFAHIHLIPGLEALVLDKLHKTLLSFKLYTERVGDIIELAKFVYMSPDLPDRSDDGTLDALRRLVVEYVVCEIDTIGKHDEFVKHMEEGGEFVGDFWRMMRGFVA